MDEPRDSGGIPSSGLWVTGSNTNEQAFGDGLGVQASSQSFTNGFGMVQASSKSHTSGYGRSLVRPGEAVESILPWGTAAPVSSSPDRRRSVDSSCGPSKSLYSPWNDHMSTGNLGKVGTESSQQTSFRHSFDVVQRPEPKVSISRPSTSQGVPAMASRPSTSQGIMHPRASKQSSSSQGVAPARPSRPSTSQGAPAPASSPSWTSVPATTMELHEERSHENLMSSVSSLRHHGKHDLVLRSGPVPANQWFSASGTDCAQQSFSSSTRPSMQLHLLAPPSSRGATGSSRRKSMDAAASDVKRSASDGHQLLGNFKLTSSVRRISSTQSNDNPKPHTQSHRQLRSVNFQDEDASSAKAGGSSRLHARGATQSQKALHRLSLDEDVRHRRGDSRRASMDSGTRHSISRASTRRISLDSHDSKPGRIRMTQGSPLRQAPNSFIDTLNTSQSQPLHMTWGSVPELNVTTTGAAPPSPRRQQL